MKYSKEFLCSNALPSREEMIRFVLDQRIVDMKWGKEAPSILDPTDYDDEKLIIVFRMCKKDLRQIYGIESISDLKRREFWEDRIIKPKIKKFYKKEALPL